MSEFEKDEDNVCEPHRADSTLNPGEVWWSYNTDGTKNHGYIYNSPVTIEDIESAQDRLRNDVSTKMWNKEDSGKTKFGLISPQFLERFARLMTDEEPDKGTDSWKREPGARKRCLEAMQRHLNAYLQEERMDPKSGKEHLIHLAVNVMIVSEWDRFNDEK